MIKTKHDVSISIDDKTFKITAHEITTKQQKQLEDKFSKHTDSMKVIQKLNLKAQRLREQFELIKEENKKEALSIHKEICKVEDEMEDAMPRLKTASDEIETILNERLLMLIDGDDKDELFECVKEKGISNKIVFDEIAKAIQESKEKK